MLLRLLKHSVKDFYSHLTEKDAVVGEGVGQPTCKLGHFLQKFKLKLSQFSRISKKMEWCSQKNSFFDCSAAVLLNINLSDFSDLMRGHSLKRIFRLVY